MQSVTDAAVLAVVYRAHYNAAHTCADDVLTDFEACPGELSLATLIGSHALTELDWQIIRTLDHPGSVLPLARALHNCDPLRAEALMHACPPNGRRSSRRWAEPYTARWQQVERAIRRVHANGLAATTDDVEALAVAAYRAVTGKTHADYLDEYGDD